LRNLLDILLRRKVTSSYPFPDVDIKNGCIISHDSKIGAYTYIGYNCTITKALIGRYCSIANNVAIGVGEHLIEKISTSSLFYDNPYETLTQNDCTVGNDVWISTNCVIRRGVKVGNGAVIGANSFVNIDVPEFAIVAGSPARIIKYRFNPDQISIINESEWWNLDLNEAKKRQKELQLKTDSLK
jgi:virginiamycin A acetyltransferase